METLKMDFQSEINSIKEKWKETAKDVVPIRVSFNVERGLIVTGLSNGGFVVRRIRFQEKISSELVLVGKLRGSAPITFIDYVSDYDMMISGGCDGICRIMDKISQKDSFK